MALLNACTRLAETTEKFMPFSRKAGAFLAARYMLRISALMANGTAQCLMPESC